MGGRERETQAIREERESQSEDGGRKLCRRSYAIRQTAAHINVVGKARKRCPLDASDEAGEDAASEPLLFPNGRH